ncbi:MAG: malto-oligosyltrehalose trehalohydrolase [Leptolyngbyaceae cyanobacterium bins.59]|nr:malto-oligosyltrehalose trehalohydrolase [Leptolyngbyaceae cyanobacterium bins.59]
MKPGAHYLGNDRCEFTVWAPQAETVAVKIGKSDDRLLPMQPQEEGYWSVTADRVSPGTYYSFQLNGDQTYPDPASRFQPEGVHGPSQVIDPAFAWTDADWASIPLADWILYELHVGTFTPEGTFEAIIDRLSYLKELGVNVIELMPIGQFPGDRFSEGNQAYRNWGYDGAYLYAVQNSYGGGEGLKRLVDACHQKGIAVVLDVVYNHLGPEGNYISCFGPFFTDAYKTPWGSAINFDDRHSYPVRQFFVENVLYWLQEYHLDGLRLDAIHAIYDLGAYHILAEIADRVSKEFQGRWKPLLIAESDLNDPRVIRGCDRGGYGMDAQWCDDFHHALHSLLTEECIGYYTDFGKCEHLAKAYRDSFVYDWQLAPHRNRFHGASAVDCPPTQFVVCTQNHDQVGNRMLGERLSHLTSFEALKLAAGALLLSPFIPMLFMGEEYGEEAPFLYFVSHGDPDLIQAVREGRKAEFAAFHCQNDGQSSPPDPESPDTFLKSKLNWNLPQSGKHQVLWSFYQHLIQLRRTLPALLTRDRQCLDTVVRESEKVVGLHRWNSHHELFCVMNFNQQPVTLASLLPEGNWHRILDSAEEKWMGSGSSLPEEVSTGTELLLQPQSFVVYERSI